MPRAKSTLPRALSDLEGAVLGLVTGTAGLTPYALRKRFIDSPAPYWSGSAGAIYPLVARLRRAGLLRTQPFRTGQRRGQTLVATVEGQRRLDEWIHTLDDATIGIPMDPLRLRMTFLYALPPSRRSAVVRHAIIRAEAHRHVIENDCAVKRAAGDLAGYLTARGAFLMMQSRLAWLHELAGLYPLDDQTARARAGLP